MMNSSYSTPDSHGEFYKQETQDKATFNNSTANSYDNLPHELKMLKQWVCFNLENVAGKTKPKKVPKNPHTGMNASSTNNKTWGTFDEAVKACEEYGFPHIGFAFTENDSYIGIDLDNCISKKGVLDTFSKEVCDLFKDTYIEYSISGKGIHIIAKGYIDKSQKNTQLEVYNTKRFFVMSGHVLQNMPISEAQHSLDYLIDKFFKKSEKKFKSQKPSQMSDQEIIKKASQAKNGSKFTGLMRGDLTYNENDHSSADLALCCLLAFWTNDPNQIDRIFCTSGLYRKKWDRQDYKQATIEKALNLCDSAYRDKFRKDFSKNTNESFHCEEKEKDRDTDATGKFSPNTDEEQLNTKFGFISVGKMIQNPLKTDWLIKSYLDADSLAVIFGDPGCMKSFVAIDIGLCVATGLNWHGMQVRKQGAVLYIAGEGFGGLSKRLRVWGLFHEKDLSNAPFFVSHKPAQFLDEESANEVEAAIKLLVKESGSPALIIIDTLNRNFGPGDESLTKDMTIFISKIDPLRRLYKCAILIVHHTGNSAKDRARGSCALRAAADWEYRLNNKNGIKTLTSSKVKDHEPPPDMSFEAQIIELDDWVDDEGLAMSSCILKRVDRPLDKQNSKQLNDSSKCALAALEEAIKTNKGASVHIETWREAAYRSNISKSVKIEALKKAFQRATKELCELGYVEIISEYCSIIKDKGQEGDIAGTCP